MDISKLILLNLENKPNSKSNHTEKNNFFRELYNYKQYVGKISKGDSENFTSDESQKSFSLYQKIGLSVPIFDASPNGVITIL